MRVLPSPTFCAMLGRTYRDLMHSSDHPDDRAGDRLPTRFDKPEFGASTGDARENDPSLPGFTPDDEVVFRSYFQHANRFADRTYEDVRPAYEFGYSAGRDRRYEGQDFEVAEKDLESH